jgi:hypothetical protein
MTTHCDELGSLVAAALDRECRVLLFCECGCMKVLKVPARKTVLCLVCIQRMVEDIAGEVLLC